jgi:CubicO group peptidase (beta-lactamase class C family)
MKIKHLLLVFMVTICLFIAGNAQNVIHAKIEQISNPAKKNITNKPLNELLDVFIGNSREQASRFVQERLEETMIEQSSENALVNHILKISEQSGGFDIVDERRPEEYQIQLLTRTRRDGRQVWIKAFLSKANKEKLRAFEIEPVPSKIETRVKQWKNLYLNEAQAISEVSRNADELAKIDKLSGVLLIAKGDKILFHQKYGLMSQRTGKLNQKNTLFPTASMSKMFTAIAVAQLIDQGRLSLDHTLEQVLPDYPDKSAAKRIKIRHLLSHRSGLGNFFNQEYKKNPDRFVRPSDYFPLFANKPLFFEPGTKFSYSNAGMVILGAIVEQISKQRFEDYLRENIFVPAGMKNTFYNPADAPKNQIASLHTRFETNDPLEMEPRKENSNQRMASPAGNSYTTAKDILLFVHALQKGKLIKQETLTTFTGQNEPLSIDKYAFGFESKLYNGKKGYGHSGGAPGINTNTITLGNGDYTVVILSNNDPGFAQVFARDITLLMANVRADKK